MGSQLSSSAKLGSAVPAAHRKRHYALVRVTHWTTTVAFLALLVSGGEIVLSHPRFYWGETGNVNMRPWHAGLAGRADAILIPEIPYSIEHVATDLKRKLDDGKPYAIVVVAEGAKPMGGDVTVKSRELGRVERLGGTAEKVAAQLQEITGRESRSIVLGHLLRGGSPTAIDGNLGVAFGVGAVQALAQGMNGVMVALQPPRLAFVPLKEAIAKLKLVPPDSEFVITARARDVSFGDYPGRS